MNINEKLETWAAILGFAHDNLSARDFDYLRGQSPFTKYMNGWKASEDPEEWIEHKPFESHPMETTLYFQ